MGWQVRRIDRFLGCSLLIGMKRRYSSVPSCFAELRHGVRSFLPGEEQ